MDRPPKRAKLFAMTSTTPSAPERPERFDPATATLSPAEQRVLQALTSGEVADVSGETGAARVVRAEFLRAVMSGACGDWPVYRGALRLAGADITGVLRAPMGEHAAGSGRTSLLFSRCSFDAPIDLSGAEFMAIRITDCDLPAFIGANLEVRADLDLSGSRLSGVDRFSSDMIEVESCAVCLNGARIGGRLLLRAHDAGRFTAHCAIRLESTRIGGNVVFDGALLDGDGAQAINARSAIIGGDVTLKPVAGASFEARGEVSFSAAVITGDLIANGAMLTNPEGRALHCEDLRVERVLLSAADATPFRSHGRINFLSATIGGNFFLSNARLSPGPDYPGRVARGGPVCINMQQMRVSNALFFSDIYALDPDAPTPAVGDPGEPIESWVLFTGAELNSLIDDKSGWPAAGWLELEGATYNRVYDDGGGETGAKRIAWLRRQFPDCCPTAATFRPQPYEELSRVLRQHGLGDEADAVAVEKIRMRLAAGVDAGWARLLPKLLMLVSLHGYSSARALISLAAYIALGTVFYAVALWGFGQPFVPVEGDPVTAHYALLFDLAQVTHARGCPDFALPWFALDIALPVIDLGQSSVCRFAPDGPARWLWLSLHSLYALAGAGLSAVVILTLSGVLRRD